MTVSDLIKSLCFFDPTLEVYIDLDDFSTENSQRLKHISQKNFSDGRASVVILDADWGKKNENIS